LIEALFEYGADIEAIDEEDRSTPLQWARRRGHDEIAALLSDRGATG
jgi:ankyrin repeat protein